MSTQGQNSINDSVGSSLRFFNAGILYGTLYWFVSANRDITFPDASGTVALVSNRKVGMIQGYTGTDGAAVGFFDDFDGKWVYLTSNTIRTIGNASSGANIAAAWTQVLFEHFWNNYTNTQCPVQTSGGSNTSRGVSATANHNANRRITLPDYRGRVIAGAGTGSGLSARTKGATAGAETVALSTSEMPSHAHTLNGGSRTAAVNGQNTAGFEYADGSTSVGTLGGSGSTGSGSAHNNVQPTAFEHILISAGAR